MADTGFARAATIAKSDTIDFGGNDASVNARADRMQTCDAIYVGGAGVVAAVLENGSVQEFTVPAGGTLFVRARRVNNTNTTATLMVALFRG